VKIYVAAVEALRKNERQDETQFTTKTGGFLCFTPIRVAEHQPESGKACCQGFYYVKITAAHGSVVF
jgi:hypothetical protein